MARTGSPTSKPIGRERPRRRVDEEAGVLEEAEDGEQEAERRPQDAAATRDGESRTPGRPRASAGPVADQRRRRQQAGEAPVPGGVEVIAGAEQPQVLGAVAEQPVDGVDDREEDDERNRVEDHERPSCPPAGSSRCSRRMNASSAAATVSWPAAVRCTVSAKNWPCGADRKRRQQIDGRQTERRQRGLEALGGDVLAASARPSARSRSAAARTRPDRAGSAPASARCPGRAPSARASRDSVSMARVATTRPSVMNDGGVTR